MESAAEEQRWPTWDWIPSRDGLEEDWERRKSTKLPSKEMVWEEGGFLKEQERREKPEVEEEREEQGRVR